MLPPARLIPLGLLALSVVRRSGHSSSKGGYLAAPEPSSSTYAVKELHARLPEVVDHAGLSCDEVVELWGVQLMPGQLSAEKAALLKSFLRARDWNVDDATFMLGEALRWRRDFHGGVDALQPAQFAPLPCDPFTCDENGRAMVHISMGRVNEADFANVQQFVAWRVCMLEQLMHRLDFSRGCEPRYTMVLDCRGMRPYHVSGAARRCAKALSLVLCDNYPDFIERVLVVSPPRLISLAWSVMGPFLPHSFSSAVIICDDNAAARMIGAHLQSPPSCTSKHNTIKILLSSVVGWIAHKVRAALTIASCLARHASEHLTPLELAAASSA